MFGKNRKNTPDAGDLIYADTQPAKGRRHSGRRLMAAVIALLAVLTILAAALTLNLVLQTREERYAAALDLLEEQQYDAALAQFTALEDYRDSRAMAEQLRRKQADYEAAAALADQQRYDEAIAAFRALGDYADSAQQAAYHVTYRKALDLLAETDAGETQLLTRILNSRTRLTDENSYPTVVGYEAAAALFESLGDHADAAVLADRCYESAGRVKLSWGDISGALAYLEKMSPAAAEAFQAELNAYTATAAP